mmetsp:Transcript_614/g.1670  ORF Transcript_614/g.1670 Transcript_614/m.1670 type:complete len:236 (-) Transcript_614:1011-1718(-)
MHARDVGLCNLHREECPVERWLKRLVDSIANGNWDAAHRGNDDLALTMPAAERGQAENGATELLVVRRRVRHDCEVSAVVMVVVHLLPHGRAVRVVLHAAIWPYTDVGLLSVPADAPREKEKLVAPLKGLAVKLGVHRVVVKAEVLEVAGADEDGDDDVALRAVRGRPGATIALRSVEAPVCQPCGIPRQLVDLRAADLLHAEVACVDDRMARPACLVPPWPRIAHVFNRLQHQV